MLAAVALPVVAAGADVPPSGARIRHKNAGGEWDMLLSQQRGKVVCLMFILTTCPHCQKLVGTMSRLQPQLGPQGLVTIAAAIQDMASLYVPDFIRDFKPAFPVGSADRNLAMQFMGHDPKYLFYSPSVSLIDRKGIIREQFPGGSEIFGENQEANFRAKIEPLLKEKAAAGANQSAAPSRKK